MSDDKSDRPPAKAAGPAGGEHRQHPGGGKGRRQNQRGKGWGGDAADRRPAKVGWAAGKGGKPPHRSGAGKGRPQRGGKPGHGRGGGRPEASDAAGPAVAAAAMTQAGPTEAAPPARKGNRIASRDYRKGPSKGRPPGGGRGSASGQGDRKGGEDGPKGLAVRLAAAALVHAVLVRRRALDDPTLRAGDGALQPRDRAFARLIAATVLRRLGEIDAIVGGFLERPLPDDRGTLKAIVRCAAAQLLFLATPAHAAINIAVEQCRRDGAAAPFDGLVNAILRRVDTEGKARLPTLDGIALDIPEWLMARWRRTYGDAVARLIAEASLQEAPLDVSAKGDAAAVALRLGGRVLETGSVRLKSEGRIEQLPGFVEGEWWVQDAAAALPVRLLGPLAGLAVADLCAAPGGKSLLMAAAGAEVTAVDSSEERIGRLQQNLVRVGLRADLVVTDATSWAPGRQFDAVLIDAPCTATGTIRRHPDILRLKRAEDVGKLAEVQTRLLRSAVHLVKPGGVIVYCTCSLEPEEGEEQIGRFLAGTSTVVREAVSAADIAVPPQWMTARGELRTLPHFLPLEPPALSGMDGFYAVRLRRVG